LTQTEEVTPHPNQVQCPDRNLALLKQFLKGRRFKLDCGHYSTPWHNLANTMIIPAGTIPQVICYDCYD
jgi:hypothetical protein